VGRVVILLLKLTHEAETQAWMYILYLFEAVYIAHDISLKKKGLECGLFYDSSRILSGYSISC
jgi:hypothetical protein